VAAPDTVERATQLSGGLQRLEWNASLDPPVDPVSGQPMPRAYVPLFIATTQDGDGAPGDQILSGLTPLPSAMAIGATWDPDLARQAGAIAGRELSAIGINMYFGPSWTCWRIRMPNRQMIWGRPCRRGSILGEHDGNRLRERPARGFPQSTAGGSQALPGRGSSDRLAIKR